MTTGTCIRCGRYSEVEYGTDGMPYCSSCIFYGTNKQCYRCRMYLPATELQQYRGQWVCPYCIQNMRDEDRKISESAHEKPHLEVLSYPERCERCGRNLEGRVYIWNGKTLCKHCLQDEQDKWSLVSGKPSGAGQRISVIPVREAKKMSLLEATISDVLAFMGFKRKKPVEIVVYEGKMPIKAAKPMTEKAMSAKREEKKPETEGLMKVAKKKKGEPGKKKQ